MPCRRRRDGADSERGDSLYGSKRRVTGEPAEDSTADTQLVALEHPAGGALEHVVSGSMLLSELQEIRQAKVEAFRDRGVDPYPPRAYRDSTVRDAKARFVAIEPTLDERGEDQTETTVVGRLVSRRHQGKTVFSHVRDGSGEIQLYLRRDDVGLDAFEDFLKLYDLGDFLQATGR